MTDTYSAKDITVLEGLEAVRKRPGMYIGSTTVRGLHHLVYEIVDNSVDEALAGYCKNITINILSDNNDPSKGNIIEVIDDGRGIPVDKHEKTGKSALEVIMTVLHAGGKFEKNGYKVSGGLHGVGASVVNALSEWVEVFVKRDGFLFYQKYENGGKPVEETKQIRPLKPNEKTGTMVRFKADETIFETTRYGYDVLKNRIEELAYLNKGLNITFNDKRVNPIVTEIFCFNGGISDYLNKLIISDGDKPISEKNVNMEENVSIENINGTEDVGVNVVLNYSLSSSEKIYSFVNNINTHEGGTHVEGFKHALTKAINDYAKKNNFIKEKDNGFTGSDTREGLNAIISIKLQEPQFEGQTKTKLGNSNVSGIVLKIVYEGLKKFLDFNPKIAKDIIDKVAINKKAREASKKARENVMRQTVFSAGTLPGKLADCSSTNPAECEVYLVEGDSAGGSAKQGRDRFTQAILALKGKILNVEKAPIDAVLANEELRHIATACGFKIGEPVDLSKLRYYKIVIMTDADVDGSHIRTLILTFFYRHCKEIIENGLLYKANPPLYKIAKGKTIVYAYSDEQLSEITKGFGDSGYTIQRYKGLGEMNPDQLKETTMDKSKRILTRFTIDDAIEADRKFNLLMGPKVEPRRLFIEENAIFVKNINI